MALANRALKPYPPAGIGLVDTSSSGGGSAPFPSGLSVWARYKASSMTGVADGATASQWDDLSGNGRHLVQASAGVRPTKRDSASGLIGNTKAFDFTPGNSYFDLTHLMTGLTEAEMFVWFKADADPAADNNNCLHSLSSQIDYNTHPWTNGVVYDNFGSTLQRNCGNPTPSLSSTWRNWNVYSKSADWRAFLDNTLLYNIGSNTVSFRTGTQQIGRSWNTGNTYKGRIAELILLSTVTDSTKRGEVDAYFRAEYAGATSPSGQVAVSWKNRNRLNPRIIKQSAATETAEVGQTTTIRIYNAASALVRTVTGLTGTTYDYTAATEIADCGSLQSSLTFVLTSVRGGYESHLAVATLTR